MKKRLNVKQFIAGSCYSYILDSNKEAFIIDPHISLLEEYKRYLDKEHLNLKFIADTHTHADHFSLAVVLKKEFKIPVMMGEKAVSDVADKRLKEGDELGIGSVVFRVIYTPGHTDDALSIYGEGRIFTGDVLLIGSVGRTDFQKGSPEAMFDTLRKLVDLPDETILLPGHDYHEKRLSTIGKEKRENPFLKERDRNTFIANMRSKNIPKPFNIDNIIRVNQRGEAAALEMIAPRDAHELRKNNPEIKFLDVRSVFEYTQAHIKDSINVPLDTLSAKIGELSQLKQKFIVLCRTGNRSPMAADMLVQSGLQGVRVLDGGITRWQKEKFTVEKGEGGISLERQVRFIAGSLVLTGIILAWLIHWALIGIPVFVSCGLIFSGLTDNCLMGMLLMKLPYNRKLYKAKLGGGTCSISG